ncbi:MAG TPA: hypothetical protein VHN18_20715, partial [Micromonosporaceae bacterium]|nr:hypothetical protein [Micromonosporaceae bacterium]
MSGPDETSPGARTTPVPNPSAAAEFGSTVAALTADDIEPSSRRQLLGRLVGQLRSRRVTDVFRPRSAMRWIADAVGDVAPYIPIRDLATLRRHHD